MVYMCFNTGIKFRKTSRSLFGQYMQVIATRSENSDPFIQDSDLRLEVHWFQTSTLKLHHRLKHLTVLRLQGSILEAELVFSISDYIHLLLTCVFNINGPASKNVPNVAVQPKHNV